MEKTKRPRRLLIASMLILPAAVLILISIIACHEGGGEPTELLTNEMVFETSPEAEERFAALLQDKEFKLDRFFKKEGINVLVPAEKWTGRLRYRGVSYQAVFFVDTMRAIRVIKKKPRHLKFALYNPPASTLSYRITIEQGRKQRIVFKKFLTREQFFSGNLNLDRWRPPFRIVLETRGKGIGAWVNPRLSGMKSQPRIFIVIVLDSLRADHASLYGYPRKTTPALDQLALDSRVFRNAYSSSCWTLPAHVSLFSGRDLAEHQVLNYTDHIREDYPLLAEVFQKNGFFTAAFTGGGFVAADFGFHRGFQVYSENPGRVLLWDSSARVLESFKKYAETFWGEDMFIFLHTYQVHAPYNFPPDFKASFNPHPRQNALGVASFLQNWRKEYFKPIAGSSRQELLDMYDTAILYSDQTLIAGVVDYLKEKGAYGQAGIVVASDHGEEFYDHGSWEHGHSLYNEVIRIPLVIKYPGNRHRGNDVTLTSITDVAALLLKDSGLSSAETFFLNRQVANKRVLPVALPDAPMIKQIPAKISFVDERYHFIYNILDKKALEYFAPKPQNLELFELYDRSDEKESNNLAGGNTRAMKEFRILLEKYLKRLRRAGGSRQRIDEALLRELRSLGYVNR